MRFGESESPRFCDIFRHLALQIDVAENERVVRSAHSEGVQYRPQAFTMGAEESDCVERIRGFQNPGSGDHPERRFHAPDSAKAGRTHYRTRRLRAKGKRDHSAGHGRGGSA